MLKSICHFILYRVLGWKKDVTEEHPNKYIICLAPHTSNWDFFRSIGGIPVWRSKHVSMTDHLAEMARLSKTFTICITPEGTRSLNPEWKKGAYFIALKANIPLLLYGVDYEKKLIQCTKTFIPTGDVDKDMHEIKQYFKDFKAKFPEKFTIGE